MGRPSNDSSVRVAWLVLLPFEQSILVERGETIRRQQTERETPLPRLLSHVILLSLL